MLFRSRGTIVLTTASSGTATITAVDTARAEVEFIGRHCTASANVNGYTYLQLTNSTTVTATRGGGTGETVTTAYQVVEWI